jgi:hypothetical protein
MAQRSDVAVGRCQLINRYAQGFTDLHRVISRQVSFGSYDIHSCTVDINTAAKCSDRHRDDLYAAEMGLEGVVRRGGRGTEGRAE